MPAGAIVGSRLDRSGIGAHRRSPKGTAARPPGARLLSAFPNVYDAAFSWDRRREAATYLQIATTLLRRAPRSVVELGCGTGTLARLWADQGLQVFGLDRSPSALARARLLGRSKISPDHWVLGDLADPRLPRRVDLAVVPLDGLGYVVEGAALGSFFDGAAGLLVPGGVLAVDLTLHPARGPPLPVRSSWKVELLPRGELRVRWASRGPVWGDPPRRWEEAVVTLRLGGEPAQTFWEAAPHAVLSAERLARLAREAGGFGAMRVYSDAAHRESSRRLRRSARPLSAQGARLICWRRR